MTSAAPTAPPTFAYETNGWFNVADLLHELGDVDASRVRMNPQPGTATLNDLIAANESKERPICEWVDGTLVEKVMGFRESSLAMLIGFEFDHYLRTHDIGL